MSNNILLIGTILTKNCIFVIVKIFIIMKVTSLSIVLILFCYISLAQNVPQPEKQSDILFKTTVFDFGDIEYMGGAKCDFIFKNISKTPVALTNVKASCGCTSPEWSKEPIKKRKKGVVTVSYDTKRIGKFSKTIYVYTNASQQPIMLRIKGNVLAQEGSEDGKPKEMNKHSVDKHKKVDAKEQKIEKTIKE